MPGMGTPELPVPDGLVLRPFRAVRFAVADLAAVTSLPYDLVGEGEVHRLLAAHPNNVVRLILPYINPPIPGHALSGANYARYDRAGDTLQAWLAAGVLVADAEPALYVYEQTGPGLVQRGIIGDIALAAPEQQIVLPHEDVVPGPVADRLALMNSTEANLEPIFLLYDGGGSASDLVEQVAAIRSPMIDTHTDDGVRHRLWAVTDPHEVALVNRSLHGR